MHGRLKAKMNYIPLCDTVYMQKDVIQDTFDQSAASGNRTHLKMKPGRETEPMSQSPDLAVFSAF